MTLLVYSLQFYTALLSRSRWPMMINLVPWSINRWQNLITLTTVLRHLSFRNGWRLLAETEPLNRFLCLMKRNLCVVITLPTIPKLIRNILSQLIVDEMNHASQSLTVGSLQSSEPEFVDDDSDVNSVFITLSYAIERDFRRASYWHDFCSRNACQVVPF